jgi:hypothetical protein
MILPGGITVRRGESLMPQVRSPFTILPQGITQFSQVAVSFERFARFFSLPLRPEQPLATAVGDAEGRATVLTIDDCELHYGRGTAPAHKLPLARVVLRCANVRLHAGALVGVVGAVRQPQPPRFLHWLA